jgi:hypothetical protein
VTLRSQASDDAGMPDDPEFRAAVIGYAEWGNHVGTGLGVVLGQPATTSSASARCARRSPSKVTSPLVIFAADKLARPRAADRAGLPIEPRKLARYRRSAEMFRAHGIRGSHLDELDRRLRTRRPGTPPGPVGLPADIQGR